MKPYHLLLSVILVLTASVTTASDIECGRQDRKKFEELICDYSILNSQYERIFREQTQLIERLPSMQLEVETWRTRRDLCDSVLCIDSVFSEWKAILESTAPARLTLETGGAPQQPGSMIGIPPGSKTVSPAMQGESNQRGPTESPDIRSQNQNKESRSENDWIIGLLILVGIPVFVVKLLLGLLPKCPRCGKWFSARETSRETIDKLVTYKTITLRDKHLDKNRVQIGTSERQHAVPITTTKYNVHHRCKTCTYEWATVATTTSSG